MNEHDRKVHQGLSGKIGKRPATKDFACEACGKLFYFEGNLTTHKRIYHEGIKREKEHICESCGKAFYRTGDLTKHIAKCGQEAIKEGDDTEVKCEKCGKIFKSTAEL